MNDIGTMNDAGMMHGAGMMADRREIVVDEVFPHPPEMVWRTLTTPALMSRWLMQPTGFAPAKGNHFTYQTTPAGAWDGVIHCEVLEAIPNERLVYAWKGGDDANVGYGSRLDTVVTWTLTQVEGGVRVRLVHSGFQLPRNGSAFDKMSNGWPKVVRTLGALAGENDTTGKETSNG